MGGGKPGIFSCYRLLKGGKSNPEMHSICITLSKLTGWAVREYLIFLLGSTCFFFFSGVYIGGAARLHIVCGGAHHSRRRWVMGRRITFAVWLAAMVLVRIGNAQTDTPDCAQCYCVADGTPGGATGCVSGGDCVGQTFLAECSQVYTLKYTLTCSGESSCNECYACVFLTDENGITIATIHGPCTGNVCNGTTATPTLSAGERYTLWVCLHYCRMPSTSDCNDCVARGYVYHNWSDCDNLASCNP